MTPLPLACSLTSPELRQRRARVLELLGRHRREERALPRGYRVRFDATAEVVGELTALIDAERRWCPFLRFQITVEPENGPVWLELTGPEGTREFLETELGFTGERRTPGA